MYVGDGDAGGIQSFIGFDNLVGGVDNIGMQTGVVGFCCCGFSANGWEAAGGGGNGDDELISIEEHRDDEFFGSLFAVELPS